MWTRCPAAPVVFAIALGPMVASQVARLYQADAAAWIACDYAGRLGALAVLVAFPAARTVAFQRGALQISWWQVTLWILALVAANYVWDTWLSPAINAALPGTKVGAYPAPSGTLYVVDVVLGLALVAYHEEILFRRFARHAFQAWLGDGPMMVITTSLIFAAYHWWSGIGNIVGTFVLGTLLMILYRRSVALWPVVAAHYLMDIVSFA
jgi:uncharacterized protein